MSDVQDTAEEVYEELTEGIEIGTAIIGLILLAIYATGIINDPAILQFGLVIMAGAVGLHNVARRKR